MKILIYKSLLLVLLLTTINSDERVSVVYKALLDKGNKLTTKDISRLIIESLSFEQDLFTYTDRDIIYIENILNNNRKFLYSIRIDEHHTQFTILLMSYPITISDFTKYKYYMTIQIYIIKGDEKYSVDRKYKQLILRENYKGRSMNIQFQVKRNPNILQERTQKEKYDIINENFDDFDNQIEECKQLKANIEELLREGKKSLNLMKYDTSLLEKNMKTLKIYEVRVKKSLEYLLANKYPFIFKQKSNLLISKFKKMIIEIEALLQINNNRKKPQEVRIERKKNNPTKVENEVHIYFNSLGNDVVNYEKVRKKIILETNEVNRKLNLKACSQREIGILEENRRVLNINNTKFKVSLNYLYLNFKIKELEMMRMLYIDSFIEKIIEIERLTENNERCIESCKKILTQESKRKEKSANILKLDLSKKRKAPIPPKRVESIRIMNSIDYNAFNILLHKL